MTLILCATSLVGMAQSVRLAQEASLTNQGLSVIELDLDVSMNPLRLQYRTTTFAIRRASLSESLTLRYAESSLDGALTLDAQGFREASISGQFSLAPRWLRGHAQLDVTRRGLPNSELGVQLGSTETHLAVMSGLLGADLKSVTFEARHTLGPQSTLSGSLGVKSGSWRPTLQMDTRLRNVDLTSGWNFDSGGVSSQTVRFDWPESVIGKLSGSVVITREGLIEERLNLHRRLSRIPVEVTLVFRGRAFDGLVLRSSAHEAPFSLRSEVRIGPDGLLQSTWQIGLNTPTVDGQLTLIGLPDGFDKAYLRLSYAWGPLSISSKTHVTTGGFQSSTIQAVLRWSF